MSVCVFVCKCWYGCVFVSMCLVFREGLMTAEVLVMFQYQFTPKPESRMVSLFARLPRAALYSHTAQHKVDSLTVQMDVWIFFLFSCSAIWWNSLLVENEFYWELAWFHNLPTLHSGDKSAQRKPVSSSAHLGYTVPLVKQEQKHQQIHNSVINYPLTL